jgi:hypothetical protein
VGVKTTTKTITVLAAPSLDSFDQFGPAMEWEMETVKTAKERAKYLLTDTYQHTAEMSQPFGYAQVCVNGECVADFFRKL